MSALEWKPGDDVPEREGGHTIVLQWNEVALTTALRVMKDYPSGYRSMCEAVRRSIAGRPLVVIDPEDREQVQDIALRLCQQPDDDWPAVQDVLRSLLAPPRPEQPGVWGVVEASCVHSDERRKWVHHEDGNWWPAEKHSHALTRSEAGRDPRLPDDWADLHEPVVVREGVTQ